MKTLPYEIAMIADKLLEHATMEGEGMKFTHADGSSVTEKQFAKNMLAAFGVTIEDLKEHLKMTNPNFGPGNGDDIPHAPGPGDDSSENQNPIGDMTPQEPAVAELPKLPDNFDPTSFSFEDLGLKSMDPTDFYKVPSGRTYRTIAYNDKTESRLRMAATLEPYKQPSKDGTGTWRAVAIVIRFIVTGPDVFLDLKTRPSAGQMDDKVTYKDKISVPFCLGGNPIYIGQKYKEREVEEAIIANLKQRVPYADAEAITEVLNAAMSEMQGEDPVNVEVVG